MEGKEKRRISLTVKLNVLILAISVLMAGGLVAIAYRVHSTRTDQYFKQATSEAASAVAAFMDGDFLRSCRKRSGRRSSFRYARRRWKPRTRSRSGTG